MKRRDQDYVGRPILDMVPRGRRKRETPKQRWMDCVNPDVRAIGTAEDEVHDGIGWRRISSTTAIPSLSGSGSKKKKKNVFLVSSLPTHTSGS